MHCVVLIREAALTTERERERERELERERKRERYRKRERERERERERFAGGWRYSGGPPGTQEALLER